MSTADVKTPINTGTTYYSETSEMIIQCLGNSNSFIPNYFNAFLSIGFETPNLVTYASQNLFSFLSNNYLSVDLKKLAYNHRIYFPTGTYLNEPTSWNLIHDLSSEIEIDTENNDSLCETRLINIQKISEIHGFLINLKDKDVEEHEISGMKDIFLKIDELIEHNDIQSIDDLIVSFLGLDFSFQFHVSLLAGTLKVKPILKNRSALYKNAISIGESLMSSEEVKLTLLGLD